MKFFVLLASLCFACVTDKVFAGGQLVKTLAIPCQIETDASDQDIEDLSNGVVPETTEGKCMLACMARMFHVGKDNKLYIAGYIDVVTMKFGNNPEGLEIARKIAEACVDVTDEDPCEAAYKISICIKENAEEYGYDSANPFK